MAELSFYIDTLSWKQLLSFLYICECKRKGNPASADSKEWDELRGTFAVRIANLGDANRHEIICSHLQSTENLDIYSEDEIKPIFESNKELILKLIDRINSDPRYK